MTDKRWMIENDFNEYQFFNGDHFFRRENVIVIVDGDSEKEQRRVTFFNVRKAEEWLRNLRNLRITLEDTIEDGWEDCSCCPDITSLKDK